MDSLPSRSNTSTSFNNVPSSNNNGRAKPEVKAASGTAATPGPVTRESKTEYLNKNKSNSHSVSKLIIVVVGLFFFFLFYKYATLRPHVDIRQRLPVCPPRHLDGSDVFSSCVPSGDVDAAARLYRDLVSLIENLQTCNNIDGVTDNPVTANLGLIKSSLIGEMHSTEDSYHDTQQEGLSSSDLLKRLIKILEENADFGVLVVRGVGDDENATELSMVQPRVQWSCWFWQKLNLAFHYGTMLTWWGILFGGLFIFGYLTYKLYVWQQDRVLREKQDVFELVEQVLSLLVSQHQAAIRGGVVARPYLAINHIRDQLIVPQDRKRKRKLWEKVVKYIRESESRVREEVQVTIYESLKNLFSIFIIYISFKCLSLFNFRSKDSRFSSFSRWFTAKKIVFGDGFRISRGVRPSTRTALTPTSRRQQQHQDFRLLQSLRLS